MLKKVQRPLTAESILQHIEDNQLYLFTGKTPKTAIRSRLSTDIDEKAFESDFVRLQKGTYGLRLWLNQYPEKYTEYEANKAKKQLMDEYLAVFDKECSAK